MKGNKSGMILYFDNYNQISGLSNTQLGILLRALIECGLQESNGQDGITGFEQRYPDMDPQTQMAFQFMSANIRRDAIAYAEKCANYRAAAQRRQSFRQEQQNPHPTHDDETWRYVK